MRTLSGDSRTIRHSLKPERCGIVVCGRNSTAMGMEIMAATAGLVGARTIEALELAPEASGIEPF